MSSTFALTARLSLAAALAALLSAAPPSAAKSPVEDTNVGGRKQCFWTRQIDNFASNDPRIVNVRVGVRDVYQFEMFGRCEDVDWSHRIAVVSRGSSYICTGLDAEIITPGPIGPNRCPVRTIRKLTPDEIKALPKRSRP